MAPGSVACMVALLVLAAGCATSQITLSDAIEAGDLSQVNRLVDEDVDVESARALLDLGADVDGLSASEHTPLLLAIFFDQSPEMVRILLDAGADPTAQAACDLGCSVAGGRPLSAREWASELGRDRLLADLP